LGIRPGKFKGTMKKQRLIYLIPSLTTGGTERVVVNLCHSISLRERFEIEVCSFYSGLLVEELAAMGIPVTILAHDEDFGSGVFDKVTKYAQRVRTIRQLIGVTTDTVVHSHHRGPLEHLYIATRLPGLRFGWVHTEHNRPEVEQVIGNKIYECLRPYTKPNILVGVSENVTSVLTDVLGVPNIKAVTVLNGIDVGKYKCPKQLQKRFEIGIDGGGPLIGAIGNLRPEKNQGLLLQAFALLPDDLNACLVLCGDGICRSDLEQTARDLGVADRVYFLGYRADVHEIIGLFDVFCLPSTFEGLPLSVLEAWAARVPVIATAVVGIKELIRHGEDGCLVPLGEPKKMAEALLLVLRNRDMADHLRVRGSQRVHSFDVDSMSKAYEALYTKVAARA
jgi:glycosyltransferase involved in cell wall biosynthesis